MLELRDWTINVRVGDVESPNHPAGWVWCASSESTPGRKRVSLTFADDVKEWDRDDLRQTVAHELIHAHLSPLAETWRADLLPHLEPQAYELLNNSATRSLEFAVDALADAVAPRLPLIDWPKGKKR
jgi:hypothetical protein